MNILEVSTSGTIATEQMGPISSIIYDLSRSFSEIGHNVTVIDTKPPKYIHGNRTELPPSVNLVELDFPSADELRHRRKTSLIKSWLDVYRYINIAASSVNFDDFDVIHTHSPQVTYIVQRFHRKPCVLTLHTPNWCLDTSSGIKEKIRSTLSIQNSINGITRASAIRNSMLTVGLGDYVRGKVNGDNLAIIPSGLDAEKWQPIDRGIARQNLGLSSQDFVLIFVGRIRPIKGVDILLDAIRRLEPAIDNSKLFLIGYLGSGSVDGKITAYARNLMKQAEGLPVQFLGYVNNQSDEFKQYVSAADVAVVPSLQEPQGLVVLEHLAMGIPVIASDVGGIPAMVTSDVGLLCPPGDRKELASRIRELYDNRDKLSRMQNNARRHVLSNFTWKEVAERYINAIAKTQKANNPLE